MSDKVNENKLKGFIAQQEKRGVGVTPELREHYAEVKYKALPWWKKLFTVSPRKEKEQQFEALRFIKALPEYFKVFSSNLIKNLLN